MNKVSGYSGHAAQRKQLSAASLSERGCTAPDRKRTKICFFGNFGLGNLGNASTIQAILYHLRRLVPAADVTCICTGPEAIAATHNIRAVPSSRKGIRVWKSHDRLARLLRGVAIGIPNELCRWLDAFITLKGTDALIVPGTGLLTDAYGLMNDWGPYRMFQWSLAAKLRGCKLLFVSVGAGPIYSRLGKFLVKSALALADFRSYRDTSTQHYLESIGFATTHDRVYPDLVFSLPEAVMPRSNSKHGVRAVVGLGVMYYAGKYSVDRPSARIYRNYLDALVSLVTWLFAHEYNVRLLIGDSCDADATQELRGLLRERLPMYVADRIVDEPAFSVEDLLTQVAATDIVVATRFHNVLLAMLCNKPVVSISFHHKCASLMREMGLSKYCLDINDLNADELIEKVREVDRNAEELRPSTRARIDQCREALNDQYEYIFKDMQLERAMSRVYSSSRA